MISLSSLSTSLYSMRFTSRWSIGKLSWWSLQDTFSKRRLFRWWLLHCRSLTSNDFNTSSPSQFLSLLHQFLVSLTQSPPQFEVLLISDILFLLTLIIISLSLFSFVGLPVPLLNYIFLLPHRLLVIYGVDQFVDLGTSDVGRLVGILVTEDTLTVVVRLHVGWSFRKDLLVLSI